MKMKYVLLISLSLVFELKLYSQTDLKVGEVNGYGDYFEANGTEIYYEVFGEGDPLLVLHGNGGSTKSVYRLLSRLSKQYKVITMDSRCHGKSACPEGDLSYDEMAEDVNSLIEHLNLESYTIWGHSDGGILGLILGYKHPERIKAMLISGANLRPDTTALQNRILEFVNRYAEIPDPLMQKQVKLMAFQPNIPIERIKEITVPVLLMVGDRDAIKIQHTLEIFKALPRANLCVLPGTSHFMENPDPIVYWITELKKPFSSPSTIEIAEQMSLQVFPKKREDQK